MGQMVAFPKYVHTLSPRSCEYELIWKKGLYRCNEVKNLEMRSSGLVGWAMNLMTSVPL